jgi:hypothetical protein
MHLINVSECGDMSISGVLFRWASTVDIQLSVLVYYKADLIIISLKIKMSCSHAEDTQSFVLAWQDQDQEDFLNIIQFLIGLKKLVD